MSFDYKVREEDKYFLTIKRAIRTKELDLSGIDLKGKTEHHGLRQVEKVYLSNNNIDNVDFLKDYSIKSNGIGVLITNDENNSYYDGQQVTVPSGKCFRQVGVYKYTANSGMAKTIPIVKIM
jgi:hypothetical protein